MKRSANMKRPIAPKSLHGPRWPAVGLALCAMVFLWACSKSEKPIEQPDANAAVIWAGDEPVTVRDLMIAFQESYSFEDLRGVEARHNAQATSASLPGMEIKSASQYLADIAQVAAFERHFANQARALGLDKLPDFIAKREEAVKEELYQKVLIEDILRPVSITDLDVREYYETNRETTFKIRDSDVMVIRGLYVFTDRRPLEEAQAIIEKAERELQSGEEFAQVAQKYSDADWAKRGEETHASPDQFSDPEILDRLNGLRDGQNTGVFESGNKLMILQRVKRIPPEYADFDLPGTQELIRNTIMEKTRQQETYLLHQQLLAKHKPLVLEDALFESPDDATREFSDDAIILSVGNVYELTVGEFQNLAAEHQQSTINQKIEYLRFLAQKAVFVAEALERGWTEKDVAATVAYWDQKQLLRAYIRHANETLQLTEEKMRTFYEENRDRDAFQIPAIYDLYYLLIPAEYSVQLSHAESVLRYQRAHQTAMQIHQQLEEGRTFQEIVALHAKDELALKTGGHIGRVSLDQLDPVLSTNLANAKLEAGQFSPPQEVYSHKYERYGYEIFYVKDKEAPRPMTYEEAIPVMQEKWENGIFVQQKKTIWNLFQTEYPIRVQQDVLRQVEAYLLYLSAYPSQHVQITNYLKTE